MAKMTPKKGKIYLMFRKALSGGLYAHTYSL
jgi:hypothetical protein